MFGDEHKTITVAALGEEISSAALDVVVQANKDSDTFYRRAGRYNVQHFHFAEEEKAYDVTKLIDKCYEFIKSSMEYAALCFMGGRENQAFFGMGFYFIGRGLHCAQDYYAHSNGVAILHVDPSVVLDSSRKHPQLTFCTPTQGQGLKKYKKNKNTEGKYLDFDEFILAKRVVEDECRKKLYCEYPKEEDPKKELEMRIKYSHVIRMRSKEPLEHPYMHLDFDKSFADKSLTALNRMGYRTAETNAIWLSRILYKSVHALVIGTIKLEDKSGKVKKMNKYCKLCGFKGRLPESDLDDNERREISRKVGVITKVKRESKMRDIYNDCMSVN
jgi:hypothetical protein